MADIKHHFRAGRMNKDLDERLVPNGEYRDAQNIEIVTSEGSSVGSIQNVLGNTLKDGRNFDNSTSILTNWGSNSSSIKNLTNPKCIGYVVDPQNDKVYWFISAGSTATAQVNGSSTDTTPVLDNNSGTIVVGMTVSGKGISGKVTVTAVTDQNNITLSSTSSLDDNALLTFKSQISCIAEFDSTTGEISPVLVDKNNILKYSDEYLITGANVISGLLSWTDNQTEPKLIKISKFKDGSSTFNYNTQINNADFTEKDITVIKQSPLNAPTLTMSSTERTQSSFGVEGGTPVFIKKDFYSGGSVLTTGSSFDITFSPQANFIKDDIIVLEHVETSNFNETKHTITVKILGLINSEIITEGFPDSNTYSATCIIQTINTNLPDLGAVTWTATLKEKDPLFEDTFVRFAYRYKYKEGQYSTFSPFSEVAFLPSEFLYESDESHNIGMQNSLRTLSLGGFDTQPEDVELVEILVKDSVSNAVYIVDVLKNRETSYSVLSESFGALVESNQILRPFDNVPKKAKAQEIIANRLIFANYYQGYNLLKQNTPDIDVTIEQSSLDTEVTATVAASNNTTSNIITLSASNSLIEVGMLITGEGIPAHTFVKNIDGATLTISAETEKFSDISRTTTTYSPKSWEVYVEENTVLTFTKKKIPEKSVKSLRTYQIGTTYSDRYGRETPVFSSKKSSIKLPKSFGITKNRINVQLQNNSPDWATHYKFFVKETSSEYYNLALDKFYFAEDGNIWLSFPSAERNKVDEETYLILKKQHDNDKFVSEKARYRVLDISNEAPAFISKKLISAGKASCSTLSVNQPQVGSTFFQFNGPEASSNPSFSSAFRTESEIQISTDIPNPNQIPTAVINGATIDSNTLELDGKTNTIRVGDQLTGTGISGNPLVTKITSQDSTTASLVLSTNQSLADGVTITFIQAPSKTSRKYEIANGGLSSSGTVYDVTLKEPIHESDEDVFASALVSDSSDISVNIFRKVIEPKDEFFGRFFVKVSRDPILDQNVIEAFPSAKSRFDIVKSETINLNLLNDFSSKFSGEVDPKKDFAWGDEDFGNIEGTLSATETHPQKGSEFFQFYFGGIDIGQYGATEDDLNINVNPFITEITKPGSLIQFSNDFGDKGEVYEVTGSSAKSEFRTVNSTKRTWISGKRRLHKVFIKNHETGDLYDDGFNSSAATSTSLGRISKISLVKKNIQIDDEKISSNNPAIFETEPKTKEGLDIYHEASNALPIIKAGMTVTGTNVGSGNSNIVSSVVDGSNIELLNNTDGTMSSGTVLTFTDQDSIYSFTVTTSGDVATAKSVVLADNQVHGQINSLDWYNVFSFGNGVESNRIRDDFNAPFIDKGPIVSTTLNEDYKEEHKTNSFIFSGIFNSTSGVNELNQFLLALPITKDINPEYGTIQRIFARDADLITFCEDKILKVLANKDALFNADGNTNLTATNRVLGQAIPFVGEYGISQNPESFASHAFRIYFADKARGAVLRLSRDGLTEISEKGMTDFFGDNLPLSTTILGSYDEDKGSYNITLNNQTLSFDERVDGWTSFKSFIPENGFSLNNIYYTYKNGDLYSHDNTVRNTFYDVVSPSSVKFIFNDFPQSVKSFKTLNYEGSDSRKYTYNGTIGATTIGAGTTLEVLKKSNYTPAQISGLTETEIKGWFADSITTDQQTGSVRFFKEKENFKFNKILGDNTTSSNLDTKEFSVQGLGFPSSVSSSGDDFHTLTIAETGDSDLTNCTISSSVTYSVENNTQIGSVSNAVFTITPNTGFVISASDVSVGSLPVGITSQTTSDTGTAGTVGNTVTVSLDITNTHTITSDSTITVDIAATANPIQYTVTGVFNTDEKNTSTSSVYNFGYSGSGDYYVNAIVNGLSTDNSPVLHSANSLISADMAIIGSGVPDNALVKTISGTDLTIKDGTGADLTATIPDDTVLRFGKEIISRTFTADTGFEFRSAPTLDVLEEDESKFSDYTSSNDFVSTTSVVQSNVNNSVTVSLSASNSLIATGMVVSGTGISSFTTVSGISSTTLTLSTAAKISANTTLSFFPASVTLKVYYVFSSNNPTEDRILLTAKAEKTFLDVADEITGMEMSTKPVGARGETRFIRIFGRAGSKFKLKRFTTDTVNGAKSNQTSVILDNTNTAVLSGMKVEGGNVNTGMRVTSISGSPTTVTVSPNITVADNVELTFSEFWNGEKFDGGNLKEDNTLADFVQTIPSTGVYSVPVEYASNSVFRTFNYEVEAQQDTALATDFNGANPTSINQTAEVTWTISPDVTLNSVVTASVDGTISSATALVIDNNSGGNIVVGDVVTGTGISGTVTVSGVTNQNNLTLSSAQSLTNDVTLTFTHVNPSSTANQSITGISLTEPKELSKSGLVSFSFIITANDSTGNTFLSSSRDLISDDFGYATTERTVGVIGNGSNANILFDESVRPFSIQAGSSSSLISGGSLPSETTISAKNVGGNFGVTLSHPIENDTLLAANNVAVDDVLTFSAPNDWIIEYSNIAGNIATGSEPNTYTITGVLEVIRFGTQSLTSSIGLANLLSVGGAGAAAPAPSNPTVTLNGLYDAASSNSGGIVRIKKAVDVGTTADVTGSGTVLFRGDGNTVNSTTITASDSSGRFSDQNINNIKFFDSSNNELTGFDNLPSIVNTKATFDFTLTTTGTVVITDSLTVTIKVELSNVL